MASRYAIIVKDGSSRQSKSGHSAQFGGHRGLTSACSPTPLRGRYSYQNRLCDAARMVADLGKLAARLTRRALGRLIITYYVEMKVVYGSERFLG
jgi:hypothetical protein